jgi:heme-degrading monooxygenase HmoA
MLRSKKVECELVAEGSKRTPYDARMKNPTVAFVAGILCASAVSAFAIVAPPAKPAVTPPAKGLEVDQKAIDGEFIGQLLGAAAQTPGFLGAELAQTQAGKRLIFVWFKNKDAVMSFYNTPIHQEAISRSGAERSYGKPMEGITNEDGPIMVVASAKPGKRDPAHPDVEPKLELAIEMYASLPGGVRFGGGGFAPETFVQAAKAHQKPAATPTTPAPGK